ncbi:MAG: ComEC/Rec2 family competence protein, partial [Paludibacter sp.]
DALHPVLRENYSHSGAMHILAVSGLHVGVIYLILSFLLSFLNGNKKLKILKAILIIILLWVYAFLTGLSPSVVRATVMFSFVAFGTCFERKSQIYNTISVSAFLMLLFNPNYLFEVGFQLSYCAVICIVYFQPKIAKWFQPKNKIFRWSWDLLAVSLAAQIGTAPIALYYFHQFANYFLLTNMIAIPVATLIIYFAVALLIVAPVPFISTFLAFILKWLLRFLNFSIETIDNLPHSISILSFDFWQLVLIIGAILFFALYFENKKFIPLFGALCLVLSVLVIRVVHEFNVLTSTKMVVYADNKNTHIEFLDGNKHSLFTTDSSTVELVAENFWIHNNLQMPIYLVENKYFLDGFFEFHKHKIYIMTQDFLKKKTTSTPLKIDYLIIGKGLKPKIDQVLECVQPRKIIVDKSVSKWYTDNIKQACAVRRIGFYSVRDNGAYILNFTD